MMTLQSRLAYLEDQEESRRRRGWLPVEALTDDELQNIIAARLGINADALTDDILRAIAGKSR
jgi:Cdc6-like AAA superfamily ATPase